MKWEIVRYKKARVFEIGGRGEISDFIHFSVDLHDEGSAILTLNSST
jgi:hypothetical protein